jgi:signal transduction histidine kinase
MGRIRVFRSPHPLAAGLVSTSVVVTLALGWAGWSLIDKQRALDARLISDQTEAVASATTTTVRAALASLGDKLRARLAGSAADATTAQGVAVVARIGRRVSVEPASALPFVPFEMMPPVVAAGVARAEQAELVTRAVGEAIAAYRSLLTNPDPVVRAGVLHRLARALRNAGRASESVAVARELAAMGSTPLDTTGIPAELAGLDHERLAHRALGDAAEERRVGALIRTKVDAGTWPLAEGPAEFYRDEVSTEPRGEPWALARALASVSSEHAETWPSEGHTMATALDRSVTVVWRVAGDDVVMAAVPTDALIGSVVPTGIGWRLVDESDRVLAGFTGAPPPDAARRVIAASGSALTFESWPTQPAGAADSRVATVATAFVAMGVFVWAATFFMIRALRREAAAAKLQADFVAAVSHEFRSPLSTMRQMTEMLDAGRVPGEDKRRDYYRVLVGEVARLQRLVETLLHFGRLEAGRTGYHVTDVDLAQLVASVADDMRAQADQVGRHLEVTASSAATVVHADEDAVRLALRNLVDNALKYSPRGSTVRLGLQTADGRAMVTVSDDGPGIPADEQSAIFAKFVRGSAAKHGRVPGTGVGLAMVRQVALAHGGTVQLASAVDAGSTFTFALPLVAAPSLGALNAARPAGSVTQP